MNAMTIAEIVGLLLKVFLSIWENRTNPELAKMRAAAKITESMNADKESFKEAISKNDLNSMSTHFIDLSDKLSALQAELDSHP